MMVTCEIEIKKQESLAFGACYGLADVYYDGTDADWRSISIDSYNNQLKSAAIHYVNLKTVTILSNNDKTFTITPINVEKGKTVILALYDGEKFIEMQNEVYTGEVVSFTTTKKYTNAKVMVWDDFTNLKPICDAEKVK